MHHYSVSDHVQILNSGNFFNQYISHSAIFSPLNGVVNRELHEKHLYSQSSHYEKSQNMHQNY